MEGLLAVIERPMLDDFRKSRVERIVSEFRRLLELVPFRLGLLVADPLWAAGISGRVRLLELTAGCLVAVEVDGGRVVI